MSTINHPPDGFSPQQNLPPVQPPTARFIIQLFVIPAVVVAVPIMIWLLFSWLAHMGANPAKYVEAMKAGRANSWQQAYNLAEELQRNEAARNDPALAQDVAGFLDELLAQPLPPIKNPEQYERDLRSEEAQRRGFLCQALGQFRVPQVSVPVLLKAAGAGPDRDVSAVRVRVAALQALAVLADSVQKTKPLDDPRVAQALIQASTDEEPIVANTGAFGLGVLGGDKALTRLQTMLKESHPPDVHYNAALGLARHGDPAGLDLIVEMIDPSTPRGLDDKDDPKGLGRAAKQARLQLNGLRAAGMLGKANTKADLSSLPPVIAKLQASKAPGEVKSEANVVLRELQKRAAEKN